MSGYLVGQVTAFLTAHFGLLRGLTLNYSSTSAVISSLLVMLMVLVSTIWPARKASRMSVPDVKRSWNPNPPEGDRWTVDFPFTVAGYDAEGMAGYIARTFRDAPEGVLTELFADDVRLRTSRAHDETAYHVSFRAWLAPFDLGVSQDVTVDFVPTGDFGVYAVTINMEPASGDRASWVRLNKRFLAFLRKRFLLWRVVPQKIKDMNVALTRELTAQVQT